MSTLAELESVGLSAKFDLVLAGLLIDETDEETKLKLKSVVDEAGLKAPKTMKEIGSLQREKKIKAGLYKQFLALREEFLKLKKSGGSDETQQIQSSSTEEKGDDTVSEEQVQEAQEVPDDVGTPDNVVELPQLDVKEEEKIKERMAKMEEKMRKRLLDRESKLRENSLKKAQGKAQRKGMKLEHVQGIKERKDQIKELTAQKKEVSGQIKKLREEIKALRPARKTKEEREAAKAAREAKKAEKEVVAAQG